VINSSVSGQGSLEIFNMFGQKIQTIYQGHVFAGVSQSFEYAPPAVNQSGLIYILKVGDKQTSGKVLRLQ
jgi:hypothetical protein